MAVASSSIFDLRQQYLRNEADPFVVLEAALQRSNSNSSHNVYIEQNAEWSREQVRQLSRENLDSQPLWGVPISLKDCFDLAGFHTSCGSSFYRERNGITLEDSAVAARIRNAGAILIGKTHLHQLAYGITGENRDFGDCVQPRNAAWLTGGSSSGAAASIQEGSAFAAIGTDTGGSIRTPAALCGLAGYRSSITFNTPPNDDIWRGGAHLAPTFDTLGWLYRSLTDGPLLARVLFDLPNVPTPQLATLSIGIPGAAFLHDCDSHVLDTLHLWGSTFAQHGTAVTHFDAKLWDNGFNLFARIQASEAAALHYGFFHHFEPTIAERLAWGASISTDELSTLHKQLTAYRARTSELFQRFDYLLIPCAPMSALLAEADHSTTRMRILRYTAPASLAGLPTVVLPGVHGGLQLIGPIGSDAELLAFSASLQPVATNLTS
jgi:Asp-tRNA(Asn)/Glu-tRNA(Gln) amidotransferase A subunit family amidase